jgi:5-methylcytosine-specific restriction endonuclease McrA
MPWQTAKKSPEYGKSAWKRARLAALRRARYRCELHLDGCQGAASEVDHIHGLASDPNHQFLRAVCTSCHSKRTAEQGHDARRGRRAADPAPSSRIIWD